MPYCIVNIKIGGGNFDPNCDHVPLSWEPTQLTKAVAVVILVPPEAPTTNLTCPSESATILGHMEDRGRFPGLMKFAADAGTPKWLVVFGVEKSSIWLLNITPVVFPTTFDLKLYFEKKLQT